MLTGSTLHLSALHRRIIQLTETTGQPGIAPIRLGKHAQLLATHKHRIRWITCCYGHGIGVCSAVRGRHHSKPGVPKSSAYPLIGLSRWLESTDIIFTP